MRQVEDAPELSMADADRSGNVLTVEFDSGEQIIINLQTPMQQVWLASRPTGGYHFSCGEDGRWVDSSGRGFWQALADAASRLSGEAVSFKDGTC